MAAYPEPPSDMKLTPDLEALWMRYIGHQANREPLPAMAYFCLTVLETSAGDRSHAARKFNIDSKVLGKIGELTERRGNPRTARKMAANFVQHTPQEISWLEEAIKLIIRRVAENASGAVCPKITMKDLPACELGLGLLAYQNTVSWPRNLT
jgi:hypothetical protein